MDIMQILLEQWMVFLGLLALLGVIWYAAMHMVDSYFPPMTFDVSFRKNELRRKYRLVGNVICKDDLLSLFTNRYKVMGLKDRVDFVIKPGLTGPVMIYKAALRADYLIRIKGEEKVLRPRIDITGFKADGKLFEFGNELLVPIEYHEIEQVNEEEIKTGRSLIEDHLATMKDVDDMSAQANPLYGALMAYLPIILVAAIVMVGCYFIIDKALKVAELALVG